MLNFIVRGDPASQGSKKNVPVFKGTGRNRVQVGVNMIDNNPEHLTRWRDAVRAAAIQAMAGSSTFPLHGPLLVGLIFTLPRPKSHYRSGKYSHLVRSGAPAFPGSKPDLSKLLRSTEDALTDAGVMRDDAQIVSARPLIKVYVGDPMATQFPGARISVRRMPPRSGTPEDGDDTAL